MYEHYFVGDECGGLLADDDVDDVKSRTSGIFPECVRSLAYKARTGQLAPQTAMT